MKNAPHPVVTIFLAVSVFKATLFPPPLVPQIKVCGLGKVGGPTECVNIYRRICVDISSYKYSTIMR